MTLINNAVNPSLDLVAGIGQQTVTYTFTLYNRVTGMKKRSLTPAYGATLTHDTTSTIKRRLDMALNVEDTLAINPITDIVHVAMLVNGTTYPLGRYVFTNMPVTVRTSGDIATASLMDEMFIIDQQVETAIDGRGRSCSSLITSILNGFDVKYDIEASSFESSESWAAGALRGYIINALANSGGYFSPWFDHNGVLRFIQSFNPIDRIPDFDLDTSLNVMMDGITQADDLLSAPNRFIVVSNAATDSQASVSAYADVPTTAPHSIANRGFVIPAVIDLQVSTSSQAYAIASRLAITQSVLQYVSLSTSVDPRYDSYDIIKWDGKLWLEVSWSMSLTPGGTMTHMLQRVYE